MDTNLPGRAGAAPSPHRRLPFDEVVEGETIFKGEQIWNRAARASSAAARPSGIGPQPARHISDSSRQRPSRCCRSIPIDESDQLFRHVGEQLEFFGVERLAQQLKRENVLAVSKGWSEPAKEKAEAPGGIRQEQKTGIAERSRELHGVRA